MKSLIESIKGVISPKYLNEVTLDNVALGFPNGFKTDHEPGHVQAKTGTLDILSHLNTADPTSGGTNEYTKWIGGQYAKQNIRQEDTDRIKTALAKIHKLKLRKKLPGFDINNHDMASVENEVAKFPDEEMKSARDEKKEIKAAGSELIHQENGTTVHKITTPEACRMYGADTSWCTATEGSMHAKHYLGWKQDSTGKSVPPEDPNDIKPLYVVKRHDGKRYQIHFESDQMMDEKDRPVDRQKFVEDNPELLHVKEFQEKHPMFDPDKERVAARAASPASSSEFKFRAVEGGGLSPSVMMGVLKHTEEKKKDMMHQHVAEYGKLNPELERTLTDHAGSIFTTKKDTSHYSGKTILSNLAKNITTSGDTLHTIVGLPKKMVDDEAKERIVSHPNTHEKTLLDVMGNRNSGYNLRVLAALHKKLSPENIRKLHESTPILHGALSVNPNTPSDVLDNLAGDPRAFVRANVAKHKNVSPATKVKLQGDKDPEVASAALPKQKKVKE